MSEPKTDPGTPAAKKEETTLDERTTLALERVAIALTTLALAQTRAAEAEERKVDLLEREVLPHLETFNERLRDMIERGFGATAMK